MTVATLKQDFRGGTVRGVYTVPLYSDLSANSGILEAGDLIKVESTGIRYICSGENDFRRMDGEFDPAGGSTPRAFSGIDVDFRDGVGVAVEGEHHRVLGGVVVRESRDRSVGCPGLRRIISVVQLLLDPKSVPERN